MSADESRAYEGLFLFGSSASANLDDTMSSVRTLIEKHGGTADVLRKWDDRKLAYEVKKQTRGVYISTFFHAPPPAIEAINREVNITDDILRCLITDASHLSAAEVEAMQPQKPAPRKSRDDDGPRRPAAERAEEAEAYSDSDDEGGDESDSE